jgi:hypothetical protein
VALKLRAMNPSPSSCPAGFEDASPTPQLARTFLKEA